MATTSNFYEAIIQSSNDAIISKTINGVVTSWNPAAEAIFGYSTEEMVGNSMLVLFPPSRENEEEDILQKIIRGEKIEHFETVRLCKNGSQIHVSVNISPIFDSDGHIVGASKIARNIDEQKKLELIVNNRGAQFRAAIETSFDGFVVLDRSGKIIEVNNAYLELSGYNKSELLTMAVSDLEAIETIDDTRSRIRKILEEGHDLFETMHRKKDGGSYPLEVAVTYSDITGEFYCFFNRLLKIARIPSDLLPFFEFLAA